MMTEEPKSCDQCLLEMRQIDKSFPGVHALKDVSITLQRGEVLGLVGENGAGKSTLIKILGGAQIPDAGSIHIEGRTIHIPSPHAAQQAGISIIYQEFNLIPELTVRENIFLGRENTRMGFVNAAQEQQAAGALFKRIGVDIDPEARCRELTVARQQIVEIAKAISVDAKIIVMDEPTAALTPQETERLFAIMGDLKSRGLGIIYISHRLEEVFEIADRAMVLRDGTHVGTEDIHDMSRERLIEMMVGRSVDSEFPGHASNPGRERLRVENLCHGRKVRHVSFAVRAGEILGIAGLVGAGRTEVIRLIFGAERPDSGDIFINGQEANIRSPGDAMRSGICLLTEDRKQQGLVLNHTCQENYGLPNLDRLGGRFFLDQRREREEFRQFAATLSIKTQGPEQRVMTLSGGNQQKVVIAKWLARQGDVMIFDEPTRGIDVGAKYEIYLLMNRLAEEGKAVIMVSSELPEILGLSDRILVMHDGQIKGEITEVSNATQEDILSMAII